MSVTSAPSVGLLLRPGVPVVRRDADTIQVGLHPPLAVRLPDRPEVRALLDDLRSGRPPGELATVAERALDALLAAGLAFPASVDAGQPGRSGRADRAGRAGLEAARAQFGADGTRRLDARRAHPVGVQADPPVRGPLLDLFADAGLEVDADSPAVWLVAATGPVLRESLDGLVRAGAPHLVVSGDAAGRRLGPFVEPGRTACLRCVDAHEAEADPRRPFLVEQAARAAEPRPPADVVLDHLVLAWAVRDLCRYLEGDEPSTWSSTVDVGPGGAPQVTRWLRHPHCGCAWDLLLHLP